MPDQSPYPDGSVFAVRKGFKSGVYTTFAEFQCQTKGFRNAVFAVYDNASDAQHFMNTGESPSGVRPLIPNTSPKRQNTHHTPSISQGKKAAVPPLRSVTKSASSTRTSDLAPSSLPTPEASPDRLFETGSPVASQGGQEDHDPAIRAYASQPLPPPAPRKSTKIEEEGDTEPEEDPLPVRRTKSTITPGSGRKLQPGSIARAIKRDLSGTLSQGSTVGAPAQVEVRAPLLTPAPDPPARTRECEHCSGTGRVPVSDSNEGVKKAVKRAAGSPPFERRVRRSLDNEDKKPAVDKGKSTVRDPDSALLTSRTHEYM